MTEIDEQKRQQEEELIEESFVRLAYQLYDGGIPGINEFAAEVIRANFTREELLHPKPDAGTKLKLIQPIFTAAVSEGILAGGVDNLHGQEITGVMRETYTVLMNGLNEKLIQKK